MDAAIEFALPLKEGKGRKKTDQYRGQRGRDSGCGGGRYASQAMQMGSECLAQQLNRGFNNKAALTDDGSAFSLPSTRHVVLILPWLAS